MEVVMRIALPAFACSVLLLAPGPIASQTERRPTPVPRPEIVIYRDRNFSGPAIAIPQDQPNLRLVWTVSSALVRGGTWQLCERPNYQGACLTLSESNSNLNRRRVQSVRAIRLPAWRVLGRANVSRFGWDHRVIRISGNPRLSELRLCAEQNRVRLHDARVRFTNNLFQALRVPSQLASGSCTAPLVLNTPRRNVSSVEVTVSTAALAARGRIRVEGR